MKYLAIAQPTAEWLLPKVGLSAVVYETLHELGA